MEPTVVIGKTKGFFRFDLLSVVLGSLVAVMALVGVNKRILGLFHDDAIYTVVAKAIYQDDGYHIISLPSAPAQIKYPFLYSYLLSWLWALNPNFPRNIVILKALNCAILGAIFILGVAFYRRYVPGARFGAICFAFLVCANPIIFTFTDFVVSDLLYVLLTLAALIFWSKPSVPVSPTNLLLSAVLTGLACLTRLAAAPLAFAGAISSLIERNIRAALYFCCVVFLFIAPWFLWVYLNPSHANNPLFSYYSGYEFAGATNTDMEGWSRGRWPILAGNALYLLDSFELLYLLPLMPGLMPFVVVLTLVGALGCVRREMLSLWTFFLLSLALLLLWPFHPGRYLAPLVPLLILFLFRGMDATGRGIRSYGEKRPIVRLMAKLVWCPVALILLLDGVWLSSYFLIDDDQTTRGLYGSRQHYDWRGFEESFAWVRENSRADALLATAYDPMYFLYTGRRAIRPTLHHSASYFYPYGEATPDVGASGQVRNALKALRADYLIVDPLDGYAEGKATLKLLDDLLASYGAKAKLVFTSADGKHRIYALMDRLRTD